MYYIEIILQPDFCTDLFGMANPNRGKRPRGDEEQDGNKRQRTHQSKIETPVFQIDTRKLTHLQTTLEASF